MSRFGLVLSALVIASGLACMTNCQKDTQINSVQPPPLFAAPMPLHFSQNEIYGGVPEPHRDESVKKWLAPSMRIRASAGSGSGTICYYDKEKNLAYVISCGHLFKSPAEKTVMLEFFYKNNVKLETPAQYTGTVLAANINAVGDDISIISFKPDWTPTYFPIAKTSYKYESGKMLYSVGCDTASEVACYFVKVVGLDGTFLSTRENSPRPGRSGGGLITEDGWYVGICVRTSDITGNGTGYFVHLNAIHTFCNANQLGDLLSVGKPVKPEEPLQKDLFHLTSPIK